jgi:hypothetical protein
MKKYLLFNYISQIIPQRPDWEGHFRYSSYHKHDIIIKNGADATFYNRTIKFIFNQKSEITNFITPDPNIKSQLLGNIAIVTIDCFKKNQSQNFDFCVAYGDINESFEILTDIPDISLKRSKKLSVKKGTYVKGGKWNKIRIKNIINNQWIVAIIWGLIVFVITYFIFIFPKSNKGDITVDQDSLKKSNEIIIKREIPDSALKSSIIEKQK